jgi:pyruvate dehydrogenase E2 component (dihydrolipoamide acetyltransferase)
LAYNLQMPQLGMTMTEGCVVKWLKNTGDVVEKGENLFIIQTDKVDMEVESPCSGKLAHILVELGQVVPVGTIIARISQPGDTSDISHTDIAQAKLAPHGETPQAAAAASVREPVSRESKGTGLVSQRAKRLARQLGLDVSLIPDYDGKGRIVEADVLRFLEECSSAGRKPVADNANSDPLAAEATSNAVRKAIAERMTFSFTTVPHFYLTVLSDATNLVKLKEELLPAIEKQFGVRLSYTDLLLKIVGVTLRAHPEVNSYWQNGVVRREYINVGFATQTADRLVVPVVRNADTLPLEKLARVRAALANRARSGQLALDDLGDASCTLSNLGSQNIDHFQAVINPPESAVLAVGRIAPRPMVVHGMVVPRQSVYISVSLDHRLIDGVVGASFLSSLVKAIESPHDLLHG